MNTDIMTSLADLCPVNVCYGFVLVVSEDLTSSMPPHRLYWHWGHAVLPWTIGVTTEAKRQLQHQYWYRTRSWKRKAQWLQYFCFCLFQRFLQNVLLFKPSNISFCTVQDLCTLTGGKNGHNRTLLFSTWPHQLAGFTKIEWCVTGWNHTTAWFILADL